MAQMFISFHLADHSLGQSVVTWTERKTQSMHPGVNGLLMGDFKSLKLTELIFSSSYSQSNVKVQCPFICIKLYMSNDRMVKYRLCYAIHYPLCLTKCGGSLFPI